MMRLIDADALADALFEKRRNYPQWVADTIGNMPTIDADSLIKEQEEVEPINSYGTFRCGNCKNIVGYSDGYWRGYHNNFCSKCGKAVAWNENHAIMET